MRVLLFTGKGGVGKTTTAAATAALAAAGGKKALVMSTDVAHSLGDALAVALGPDPVEVDTGLCAQQVDPQDAFRSGWASVQHYLRGLLDRAGVDPLRGEELTVLPGAEEVLALLELRTQVASGRWDVVCVDCAPTGETLRLLALPEVLQGWADKLLPTHRRALLAARPLLTRSELPVPSAGVVAAVERLTADLRDVRQLLTAPDTSVRLVLTPEQVVVAEARRTLTALALHGYRVDAVVANRVFPSSGDAFLAGWVRAQAEQLDAVRQAAGQRPVLLGPYLEAEPVGLPALTALGEALYGELDPLGAPGEPEGLDVQVDGPEYVLALPLPHARRSEVDLARVGDELVVTAGSARRVLALPSLLRRCTLTGAALVDDHLRVRFAPDPDLWPVGLARPGQA